MDTFSINNLIKIETCYLDVLLKIFCNKNAFLYDLDQNLIQEKFHSQMNSYDLFTETFKSVVDHHAPLK